MATIKGNNYSSPKNINLKGGILRFDATKSSNPLTNDSTGYGLYINSSGQLIFWNGTSTTILGSAGSLANFSLNDAYTDGSTITVSGSAVTLAGSHATNNVLALTLAGTGTGNMIDIQNNGTGTDGYDIIGTDDAWYVSSAGALTAASLVGASLTAPANLTIDATGAGTITVAGTSTGAITLTTATTCGAALTVTTTLTVGTGATFSDGAVTMTDNSNAQSALKITNDTQSTYGNASDAGMVMFTSETISTGALLHLSLDETNLNGGYYLRCWGQDASAAVFAIKEYGATTITGNAAGTTAFTITAGDLVVDDSDASKFESEDGTTTLLTLDNKAGVIASASAVLLIDAGGAVASGGNLLRIAATGSPNAGAIGIEFVGASKAMTALYIDADPTASNVATINGGGALTSDFAVLTVSSDGALATGSNTFRVDTTGTPASGAIYAEFDFAGLTDTNENIGFKIDAGGKKVQALYIDADPLAGDVAYIKTDGATADNKAVLNLVSAGTPAAAGSNVLRVEFSGTATNTPCLVEIIGASKDCQALNIDADPTALDVAYIHSDAVIADNKALLSLHSAGATAAGSSVLRLAQAGTPAAATSYTFEIDNTGSTTTNNAVCVRINNHTSTGAVIQATSAGAASPLLDLYSTNTGTTGVVITTTHTSTGSAVANDAVLVVNAYGLDAGDASTLYARIEAEIMTATAGQEDGRLVFSAAANDSTLTQMATLNPRAGGSLAELVMGSGAGAAYVTSSGAYDLILDTNQGTDSGNITITDGANGNITLTPNGTGAVSLAGKVLMPETTTSSGAGAVAVTGAIHEITTTAADALTLADGTEGQVLFVVMVTDGGDGTLTPTNLAGTATTITFDAVGDAVTLLFTNSEWYVVGNNGCTLA